MMRVVLEMAHRGEQPIENITVSVHTEAPITAAEPSIVVPSLRKSKFHSVFGRFSLMCQYDTFT